MLKGIAAGSPIAGLLVSVSQFAVRELAQGGPKSKGVGRRSIPSSNRREDIVDYDTESFFIGSEDLFGIMVWKNPDRSRQVTVSPDGKVSFPLIEDVTALGKTAAHLSDLCAGGSREAREVPSQEQVMM